VHIPDWIVYIALLYVDDIIIAILFVERSEQIYESGREESHPEWFGGSSVLRVIVHLRMDIPKGSVLQIRKLFL